jgi:two-component system response regulator YesN
MGMISLLIADDEPIITKGLEKLLNWKKLGIEIVGTYNDGQSAWEAIFALRPEIALLDISMPGMTGIEVLKKIQENHFDTSVIFISGFQDFAYVKGALLHGAKDYILKPIVRSELLQSLSRCISVGMLSGSDTKEETIYSSLLADENRPFHVIAVEPVLGKKDTMEKLIRFSLTEKLQDEIEKNPDFVSLTESGKYYIVAKQLDTASVLALLESLGDFLHPEFYQYLSFIVSPMICTVLDIEKECRRCDEHREYAYFAPYLKQKVFCFKAAESCKSDGRLTLVELRNSLYLQLLGQQKDVFDTVYKDLIDRLSYYPEYNKEECCYYLCNTLRIYATKFRESKMEIEDKPLEHLMIEARATATFFELYRLFYGEFSKLFEIVSNLSQNNSKKDFVIAIEYIEKHYNEPLCLKNIADYIGMNTYYFSSYFKKNVGINFKDYLRNLRLEHAMNLIVSTDMSMGKIAKAVGFYELRTFSEIFQKTYKEKPSEYIKRVRNGSDLC